MIMLTLSLAEFFRITEFIEKPMTIAEKMRVSIVCKVKRSRFDMSDMYNGVDYENTMQRNQD